MFKLTTVADKIKQEHGKDGMEILGLDMFQKLCDPLLANSANYNSLSKKAYMVHKPKNFKDSSFLNSEMTSSPRIMDKSKLN